MAEKDASNIFGMAITVAYVQALPYSVDLARYMSEGIAQGFDLSETDGDEIYLHFQTESHPEIVTVFSTTPYTTYLEEMQGIMAEYLPEFGEKDIELISIAAQAMMFAYAINTAIEINDFQKLMGKVLQSVCIKVIGSAPFSSIKVGAENIIQTPFSSVELLIRLLAYDYSSVITSLGTYSKDSEVPMVNYNWYDVANILQGPDLQIMKDVENQYYRLSGVLQYDNMLGTVEECLEDSVTISTWSGTYTGTYIRNTPCRKIDSYIGPVDYVKFNRIFNDGPPSNGYFTDSITGFYINNDKLMLETGDYTSNSHDLFTVSGTPLMSQVFIDANGPYDLLNGEYNNISLSYGCDGPYQKMRVGDNQPRYIYKKTPCSYTLQNLTGFKYASLELPDEDWSSDTKFRQTNPLSEEARILKRAWNINDNPYISTEEDGILYPYFIGPSPLFTHYWYVGYPVLNGINELPQLGFFQTFRNDTFGERFTSLVMYPTIATSAGNQGENAMSSRSYQRSTGYLFSGVSKVNSINFNEKISANLSKKDETTKKFFGMGDAFSGQYNITVSQEENAGFLYTGFNVISGGQIINSRTLSNAYTGYILNKYKTIKYISGFRRLNDGTLFGVGNKFATGISGKYYTYAYFDKESIPVSISDDNWSYFAPVPTAFDNAGYEKVYGEQTVENYFPRYYRGPFSTETRVFLYPNAQEVDKEYGGKVNGIPSSIRFRLTVREEAVRELYCSYDIYPWDVISPANYQPVIRSEVLRDEPVNPKMTNLFYPDDARDLFDYNFNYWGTGDEFDNTATIGEWVDNNWAPKSGDFVPSGRNSNEFTSPTQATTLFKAGVKKKYNSYYQYVTKTDSSPVTGYSLNPMNDGLFHSFKIATMTGSIKYTLPIFDLPSNALLVNQAIQDMLSDGVGYYFIRYNGRQDIGVLGQDPLYFESVGGRRVGSTASSEGGYHSKGIIGDRWNGVFKKYQQPGYNGYGFDTLTCRANNVTYESYWRCPELDDRVVLFNSDASGSDLITNGMKFSPYIIERNTAPLTISTSIPYTSERGNGTLSTSQSGEFVNFDLGVLLSARARTGSATDNQWLFSSGVSVGPVDRDIEIGITNGQEILACSELYINNEQMTHYFENATDCDKQFFLPTPISKGRVIKTAYPVAYNSRSDGYSIITIIPSGEKATFNVFSKLNPEGGLEDYNNTYCSGYVGVSGSAILSMRTHVPLDADDYISYIHSGEPSWMSSKYFIGGQPLKKYRINHNRFEELGGVHEFIVYSKSGKIYPKPTETLFKALPGFMTYDNFGNEVYSSRATPENYWRNYSMANNQIVTFSGYREGSRISFEIDNISVDYDKLPYQTYQVVAPSGKCTLSGSMSYYGQADNCVFSEGVHLVNATENEKFTDIYNPEYVSDTLRLVTGLGIFSYPVQPTGDSSHPILVAPSVMKQRQNQLTISADQKYTYLLKSPPYNYNKLWWPALSDLEKMNPGETIERIPPGDGNTFDTSTMLFSASQGQELPNGLRNPNILKQYYVQDIFQVYDSVSTDSTINSGKCITSGRGTSVVLSQNQMSGELAAEGTPLTFIAKGLI